MSSNSSEDQEKISPVVFTSEARCRDCYRCLRRCPVKAVKMVSGQAAVDSDSCIACGTCVKECPQNAKAFRNDIGRAQELIESNAEVVASIAPSYIANFSEWECKVLPSALRMLGFKYVAETAQAAGFVAQESWKLHQKRNTSVTTACSCVVEYVKKYQHKKCDALLPVLSPMLAHASMLRHNVKKDLKVVFIGPCIAKKLEADKSCGDSKVDVVLTFKELQDWIAKAKIIMDRLEESPMDYYADGAEKLFPLPSGLIKTAGCAIDCIDSSIITISGFEELEDTLESISKDTKLFIEASFCKSACLRGSGSIGNIADARKKIIDYSQKPPNQIAAVFNPVDLKTKFEPQILYAQNVEEQDILKVLSETGKTSQEDELDCGACGYETCRDKAVAVIRGFAEIEMCIPYMRRLAEQRTDRIIETSPNGIIMLDDHLNIISMNAALKKMFICSDAILGKHVSYLVDPEPFELVLTGAKEIIKENAEYKKYNLVTHQIIYKLERENQIVGILVNITKSSKSHEQLAQLRSDTVEKAHQMLHHQLEMAQNMARYLGESTAQSEAIIKNLIKLAESDSDKKNRGQQWDIFTSR